MKITIRSIAMAACVGSLPACDEASLAHSSSRWASAGGYLQATYLLDGESIELHSGHYERAVAPDSSNRERVWVMEGSAVHGDLDGDGDEDVALLLLHDPGGSGKFSFLAVAVQSHGRFQGSNALFLGDRISAPIITVHEKVISIRFQERLGDAALTDPPTQVRVLEARLTGRNLTEVGLGTANP